MRHSSLIARACLSLALCFGHNLVKANLIIGPWTPLFKGIDYSVSTNRPPTTDFPDMHVVHAFRVDLQDPDIRLLTTPRIADYQANDQETAGLTVSDFLLTNHVQAAINANFFGPGTYYLPAGTPMDVYGLSISEGVVVSAQESRSYSATFAFDAQNRATVIHTNWPAHAVTDFFTAVSGSPSLVIAGKNVASKTSRELDPRTAFGLSEDRRYLYLVGIDGRQPGYSNGASDYETAGWLLVFGAYDGINLDGGGSTTLVIQDSTGVPIRLNESSAVADSGRERTVGSHFGVFAKPLPGFINDVTAQPDDRTATITWTTVEPASTEVQYGLDRDLGSSSGIQSDLVTNHTVQLSGLKPGSNYYYRVASAVGTQAEVSSLFVFTTTNYVTTNLVFDLTQSWSYEVSPLSGTNWAQPAYDDSLWDGSGPGLLWVDVTAAGPNTAVNPRNTQMPANPNNNGYPYVTYYFRTHFTLDALPAGSQLAFSSYIDDGAVFYMNGVEFERLRMPATVTSQTLATGYPCGGSATCLDIFTLPIEALAGLAAGDNVLAAEVHNYNLRSPDITFGLSLSAVVPVSRNVTLHVQQSKAALVVSWDATGYTLQSATAPQGPWTDVYGATESPVTVEPSFSSRFYRLRR